MMGKILAWHRKKDNGYSCSLSKSQRIAISLTAHYWCIPKRGINQYYWKVWKLPPHYITTRWLFRLQVFIIDNSTLVAVSIEDFIRGSTKNRRVSYASSTRRDNSFMIFMITSRNNLRHHCAVSGNGWLASHLMGIHNVWGWCFHKGFRCWLVARKTNSAR